MDNHIVIEKAKTMRKIAKAALKGHWLKVALCFAVYYLLVSFVPSLLDDIIELSKEWSYEIGGVPVSVTISSFKSVYEFLLSGVFSYGITAFFVTFLRTRETKCKTIFSGFEMFFKNFWLMFLIGLKTFLWALLFVIPGFIATIRYSQSYFVLYDHPDYSAMECINESKRLMTGNKGKYFLFLLSYIGWLFLAAIPAGIYESFIEGGIISQPIDLAFDFISLILIIPSFFVESYVFAGETVFYDLLTEKLVPTENENN